MRLAAALEGYCHLTFPSLREQTRGGTVTGVPLSPEHRQQGATIALLAATINRQIESAIPYFIWQAAADNKAMLAFVRRYLQPYLLKQTERRISRKILQRIAY